MAGANGLAQLRNITEKNQGVEIGKAIIVVKKDVPNFRGGTPAVAIN